MRRPTLARTLARTLALPLALVLLVPAAAGAQRSRRPSGKARRTAPERPAPPMVRLVVRDTAVEADGAAVREGLVRVRLVNRDSAWHDALLVRLADSSGASDIAGLRAGQLPAGAELQGGPAWVVNGDSADAVVPLREGAWAIAVRAPGTAPGTAPGAAAWRVVPLAVTARPADAPRPAISGSARVTMADYRFDLDEDLDEGVRTVRVHNAGARPHEVVFYRLLSGRTLRDFGTWYTTTREGPPPALPVGGATMVAPGQDAWAVLSLRPGRYFMVCTVMEAGLTHAQRGMVLAFEVEP